jgi:uncharacterized protein with PQ loop repeat
MSRTSIRLHSKKKFSAKGLAISRFILIIAIIEPLFTSGQIWQIFKHKEAKGNSLATWVFYDLSAVIWLFYALKIKNKPLIITETLWIITQTVVIIEILHYS